MRNTPPQFASTVPAGFWARGLALLVDYVLEVIALAIVLVLVGSDPAMAMSEVPPESPLEMLIVWILPVVATLLFWVHTQSSPGKMVISARIVDARTGEAASTGQLVVRYVGYLVSALPLGLGFVWAAFDGRKQTWHDKLARTVVVRPRPVGEAAKEVPTPIFAPPAPAPTIASTVAWPRCPAGAGPWTNAEAGTDEPSLVWLTHDTLHLAAVRPADLPGFAAAAAAGHGVPSRAVPLWCLHSVEGPDDSGEITVTYAVRGGAVESTSAHLRDGTQREQLLSALLHQLGPGWSRVVERENRWALAGNLTLLALAIGAVTLFLQWGAGEMDAGRQLEIQGTDRTQLYLWLALWAAKGLGSSTVGVIGKIAVALTALLIPVVLFSPPSRFAIRRATPAASPQPAAAPYAYPTG